MQSAHGSGAAGTLPSSLPLPLLESPSLDELESTTPSSLDEDVSLLEEPTGAPSVDDEPDESSIGAPLDELSLPVDPVDPSVMSESSEQAAPSADTIAMVLEAMRMAMPAGCHIAVTFAWVE